MILRKIKKGLYEVIDTHKCDYRVASREMRDFSLLPFDIPDSLTENDRWCIFEQSGESNWIFLGANESLKDSLELIEIWEVAPKLGT